MATAGTSSQNTPHKKGGTKRRIGILGGSFNPPHYGHLDIAKQAKTTCNLDEVWLLISPQNPLKPTQGMAPFKDRFHMCSLLAEPHKWLIPSAFEHEHALTFSAHTAQKLKHSYNHHFYWILGTDNLAQLHLWNQWQYLVKTLPIIALQRGENTPPTCPALNFFQENGTIYKPPLLQESQAKKPTKIVNFAAPALILTQNTLNPISATQIRNHQIAYNKALPKPVQDYIALKNLYPKTIM